MSETKKVLRPAVRRDPDPLMARIDDALASWPSSEEKAGDGERRASETLAKAAAGASADGDDPDLLAPPLPARPGEGPEQRRSRWSVAGSALLAAAAMAAAVGVVVHLRAAGQAEGTSAAIPAAATSTSVAMGGGGERAATGAAGQSAQAAPARPVEAPGVDPATLPQARDDRAPALRPGQGPALRPASPARAPAAGVADQAGPADLLAAQPLAAADDTLRPAGGVAPGSGIVNDPSNIPRRPSFGAAQAALGAVLPAARACVQSRDAAYRVTVTFQSNGAVRDVGLPDMDPQEAACVRSALSKASLPPFAEPTFAAPVTVRAASH
jgi:hypothetical protein